MNRRTFLQLLALLPFAPLWRRLPARAEPYDASGGQWVFDGVNGLTFPAATTGRATTNAARITRFKALTSFEQVREVLR